MQLVLNSELHASSFASLMTSEGEVIRKQPGRCTQRILLNNQAYFIKQHTGAGWREIFKNLLQGKWPILSAKNEWLALQALTALNISTPTIAGYGYKGCNPARIHSFLITKELPPHISLEDLTANWSTSPPSFRFKHTLIKQVAEIARKLHTHGINHRDFYLCHFLLALPIKPESIKLYLIDLHRAAIRKTIPLRWQMKDLAGLYFSSKQIGLTERDLLRFIKYYRQQPLQSCINNELVFWQTVRIRGEKLYRKHQA